MEIRNFLLISGIVLSTSGFSALPPVAPNTGKGALNTKPSGDANCNPSGCDKLNATMKIFANRLSVGNKQLFCNVFTDDQRLEAIHLHASRTEDNDIHSADSAVEEIARQNNLLAVPSNPGDCHAE